MANINAPFIDEDYTLPQPILTKYEFDYSISSSIANLATLIGSSMFWIISFYESSKKILAGELNKEIITWDIICFIALVAIAYTFIKPKIMNTTAIPIYSADTIINPAMSHNIVNGFIHHRSIRSKLKGIKQNFQYPNLTPDVIHIFNTTLMSFYGVCESTFTKLETITETLDEVRIIANENRNRLIKLEAKVDSLEAKVDSLEAKVDSVIDMVSDLKTMIAKFSFVIEK